MTLFSDTRFRSLIAVNAYLAGDLPIASAGRHRREGTTQRR